MKTKVINMFATVTGGAVINDNLAFIDILKDCFLTGWSLNTDQAMTIAGDVMNWELSAVPVSNNNDNNNWSGTIDTVNINLQSAAAGSYRTDARSSMSGVAIPLRAGQRLYIHNFNNRAALTGSCHASLYITD